MSKVLHKTTRPKVEKAIIAALATKLNGEYTVPTKPDKNETGMLGRFYSFTRTVNNSTFRITLRFFGGYQLRLETRFCVHNKEVAAYLKAAGFSTNSSKRTAVIEFDMESFFARDHGDIINLQKTGGLESINTMREGVMIFKRYFDFVNKECIPVMSTAEDLHAVLNSADRFKEDGSPDVWYNSSRQGRIMCGSVLALAFKKIGYKKILQKYRKTIKTNYEPKEYKEMDLCLKVIEKALA